MSRSVSLIIQIFRARKAFDWAQPLQLIDFIILASLIPFQSCRFPFQVNPFIAARVDE